MSDPGKELPPVIILKLQKIYARRQTERAKKTLSATPYSPLTGPANLFFGLNSWLCLRLRES